jgi:hypothetical protein
VVKTRSAALSDATLLAVAITITLGAATLLASLFW